MPFKQVWFAGNHADIGGSYPENESRLSDITLKWMVDFITEELPPARKVRVDGQYLQLHPASHGMMHDELMDGIEGSVVPWLKKVRPVDPAGSYTKRSSTALRFRLFATSTPTARTGR